MADYVRRTVHEAITAFTDEDPRQAKPSCRSTHVMHSA
jgi:hypothetical protein